MARARHMRRREAHGFHHPAAPRLRSRRMAGRPHHRRLEPLVKDWGLNGFGTPEAIYLVYLVKLVIFVGGAVLAHRRHVRRGWTRQHRRLVGRTDRLPEVRRVDAAVGDPRTRLRVDAPDLPLPASHRRSAVLAAARDDAPAAVAEPRAAHPREPAHAVPTSRCTASWCIAAGGAALHRPRRPRSRSARCRRGRCWVLLVSLVLLGVAGQDAVPRGPARALRGDARRLPASRRAT